MEKLRFLLVAVALPGAFAIGCGGGSGSSPVADAKPNVLARAMVGPSGLTLEVDDPGSPHAGLRLTIPPQALSSEVEVSIRVSAQPSIPGNPHSYEIGPSGMQLNAPATLTLPRSPELLDPFGDELLVLHRSGATGTTELLSPQSESGRLLTVSTRHFSSFESITGALYRLFVQPYLLDVEMTAYRASGREDWITSPTEPDTVTRTVGKGTIGGFWNSSRSLLLVHGWSSDATMYTYDRVSLESHENGVVSSLGPYFEHVAAFQYPSAYSVDQHAAYLAETIRRNAGPNFRCVIVAHSLGGLVVREMLEWDAVGAEVAPYVEALITLGTPHKGYGTLPQLAEALLGGIDAYLQNESLIDDLEELIPSITDARHGIPSPAFTPSVPYYLVAGGVDAVVAVSSAHGVATARDKLLIPFDGHSAIYQDARENGLLEQARLWLGPQAGRMVYCRAENGVWNLWIRNMDSGVETRLTDGSGIDFAPSLSPDGQQVAFAAHRGGTTADLYVIDLDDPGTIQPIVTGIRNTQPPVWSPDGSKILFAEVSGCCDGALYTVRPSGAGLTQILNGYIPRYFYSPDGFRILLDMRLSASSHSHEIHQYIPQYQVLTRCVTGVGAGRTEVGIGGISPDGERMVHTRNHGLYVRSPDCGVEGGDVQLFAGDWPQFGHQDATWSFDGSWIVFERGSFGAGGDLDIYRCRPDGSGLSALVATSESERWPHWGRGKLLRIDSPVR